MLKGQFDVCAHTVNKKYDNHIFIVACFFFLFSMSDCLFYTDANNLFQCLEE